MLASGIGDEVDVERALHDRVEFLAAFQQAIGGFAQFVVVGTQLVVALDHQLQVVGIAIQLLVQRNGTGAAGQAHGLAAGRSQAIVVKYCVHGKLTRPANA
jgi:hypothetical protein